MLKKCGCDDSLFLMAIIVVFIIIGILFIQRTQTPSVEVNLTEGFNVRLDENEEMFKKCPTTLIQDGNKYFLFNSQLPEKDGVNPYVMESLDEYVELLEYQRSKNIDCPVLFVQNSYNSQGLKEYKYKKTPGNQKPENPPVTKLLDAHRESKIYNQNMFSGFDKQNLYVGEYTPLDARFYAYKEKKHSPNAMDPNWGGAKYSNRILSPDLEKRKAKLSTDFTPKFIYEENRYKIRE